MTGMTLVVIKSADIEGVKNFYEKIGIVFKPEKHANGPKHYSAKFNDLVFEIYPSYGSPTINRLGFSVDNLDLALSDLGEACIILPLQQIASGGRMAVVQDPEGRRVELYQNMSISRQSLSH